MSLQVVHLRINDASTRQPTPVRLRLTDEVGRYYAPLGRLLNAEAIHRANPFHGGNVLVDGEEFAYIPGACEVLLPAGPIRVQVCKGPRFVPLDEIVERPAGKMAYRFEIQERSDWPWRDWKLADLLVRNLSPKAAALMGAAEGLDLVHLVAEQSVTGEVLLLDDYSGEGLAAELAGCEVQVGTLNHGGKAGDLVLFNTHRIVFPLRLDAPGFEHYGLVDWLHQAQRKAGMAFYLDGTRAGPLPTEVTKGLNGTLVTQAQTAWDGRIPASGRLDWTRPLGLHRCRWPRGQTLAQALRSGLVQPV